MSYLGERSKVGVQAGGGGGEGGLSGPEGEFVCLNGRVYSAKLVEAMALLERFFVEGSQN